MVIDRLGTDLQKRFEECGKRFPRKLVLQLGLRLVGYRATRFPLSHRCSSSRRFQPPPSREDASRLNRRGEGRPRRTEQELVLRVTCFPLLLELLLISFSQRMLHCHWCPIRCSSRSDGGPTVVVGVRVLR